MSRVDSDFENAGFDAPFDAAPDETQNVFVQPKPVYRKQEFNFYSLMLILSFVMLLTSIILLFVEVGRFE
jgi:hypothetical protein